MSREGGLPRPSKATNPPQWKWAVLCSLALMVAATALNWLGTARAQAPDDPVERLRRTLQANYPDGASRDRGIKQCLAGLRSLSDLRRAVTLVEWRETRSEDAVAKVDRANHATVVGWFSTVVRRTLRRGDPAAAETMEMLAQMAAVAHANGEPATLVRAFAPDLADVVIQGPPRLRAAAARALGQIEPSPFVAVPALGQLLHASDANQRQAAADGLAALLRNSLQAVGEVGALVERPAPRAELVLVAISVLPAIHHGLDDSRPEVRRRCLETLGLAGASLARLIADPVSAPPASEGPAPRRPIEAEREEVRALMLALRDQGPILVRALRDNDTDARVLAHKAIEEMAHARFRWARRVAAAGVRAGAPEDDLLRGVLSEAVPALAEDLGHRDARVRRGAMDALEMLGPLALPALPALARALEDPDRFLRWSAVRTLGNLGLPAAPRAGPGLTRLLRDPDVDLRLAAVGALARLNPQRSTGDVRSPPAKPAASSSDALVRSLTDMDVGMRVSALHGLRSLKRDARPILPVLLRALSDSDARVRKAAAEALGAFGPAARDAADELRLTLNDPDVAVRRAASAALLDIVPTSPQ